MSDLVPVIDISGWSAADPGGRARLAAEVDRACREVGFLQIVGHGVPRAVIDDLLAAADAFFARPVAEKLATESPRAELNRGYASLGSESLSYSLGVDAPPDLFEAFNIGADDLDDDDPVIAAERHRILAPNIWPDDMPGFREALVAYFAEAARLAHRLTSICAVALGLADDFFEDKTDHSTDTMRVIRYERRPGSPDPLPGQVRMGAHTDYGILTVLYADDVAGLEIVAPDGTWQSVIPVEGALLVNLGDLLAEWTNDRWRSTLHRVVPPPVGAEGPALRRSVAFFHDGNYDALVEVLATCCSAENPPRYPTILAGDHLMAKLTAPRNQVASTATDFAGDRLDAIHPLRSS
ncbi:MAG: isopenicillin N synthase family dioxygenase [Acidimicrobiales bacterium]